MGVGVRARAQIDSEVTDFRESRIASSIDCSSASESQVFEIIHLDEDKEKVSNKDKIITGKLLFQMCSSGE